MLRGEQRRVLKVAVLAAAVIALLAAGVLMAVGERGRPAAAQHDVLMYMQYARALAEGHPYEYQVGDPPSTGSTSHLYPAVLSVFYRAGLRGDNLLIASLLLNTAFYVLIVALVGLLASATLPHLMWLALALTLFSGPTFLGVFGQTDMGLFMVCASGVWVALLYGRPLAAWGAITGAVWTRPEGLLVSAALLAGGIVASARDRRFLHACGAGLWGLAQFALMLMWNRWLTGSLEFHSILGKGHFTWHPVQGALKLMLRDAAHLISGLWFSAPTARYAFRVLYGVPVISGALAAAGWVRLVRSESPFCRALGWGWFLMLAGALALNAAGGWQGYYFDRQASWLFPFIAVLVAGGANGLYEARLRSPRATRAPFLSVLLSGYAVVVFPAFVAALRGSAWTTASQIRFAREAVSAAVPEGQAIGVLNYPGLAYVLPRHRIVHLGGYISPRFAARRDFITGVEILKHEADKRFGYWLLSEMERRHPTLRWLLGPTMAAETDVFPSEIRLTLSRADFTVLEGADRPLIERSLAVGPEMMLRDRMDVGYDVDEREHAYRVVDRDPKRRLVPGLAVHSVRGRLVGDVGRVVLGEERFIMRAQAGHPARLIWRTGGTLIAKERYDDTERPFRVIALGTNGFWRVYINDALVGSGAPASQADFEERAFDIPAAAMTSDTVRVRMEGDAVSFAWWLYQ